MVQLVGYGFIAAQLAPALLVALTRLGLITPPPLNTFTAISNNAMDAAIADGEIPKLMGTVYGQNKWYELISSYYSSGETTAFLTDATGLCSQHPAWCEGVVIPLTGGIVGP